MKKRYWLLSIWMGMCLTACGPKAEPAESPVETVSGLTKDSSEEAWNKEDEQKTTVETEEPDEGGLTDSTAEAAPGDSGQEARALTLDELNSMQEFINEHYGFLLSDYEDPRWVNLEELFYNGAGSDHAPMTDEEREAYLKAIGDTELMTDLTHLTTSQIDSFLVKNTGFHLNEMKHRLGWTYLPEYDAYYMQHGDTNIRKFICEKGVVQGDTYQIWCMADQYTNFLYECIVTLKKSDSGYQFVSNQVIWDEVGSIKPGADDVSIDGMRMVVKLYKEGLDPSGLDIGPGWAVNSSEDFAESVFDSGHRYYTEEELRPLRWNKKLLAVFRNEIYARHGYQFTSEFWNEFFGAYTWYHGAYDSKTFDPSCFNEYEKENIKLAERLEKAAY